LIRITEGVITTTAQIDALNWPAVMGQKRKRQGLGLPASACFDHRIGNAPAAQKGASGLLRDSGGKPDPATSRQPIGASQTRIAEAREAQQHHHPSRRLGNGATAATAAKVDTGRLRHQGSRIKIDG
jgi:hypothetical protein